MATRSLLAVAAILVLTGAGPRNPVDEDNLRMAAPGKPVVIGIGFHVIGFGRITAREESFDLTGYLELRWKDPRLAIGREAGHEPGPRRVSPDRIWIPRICFDNASEPPKTYGEVSCEVDEQGQVTYKSILSGKFTTPMDLRRFPFDDQILMVRIALFDKESQVRFEAIEDAMRMHDDAMVSDWTVKNPTHRIESHRYSSGESGFSALVYEVDVSRRSAFYLWRVMIPIALLATIPWVIFWFDPTNLQPQISTCMATFIALVTFNFGMDFGQPKAPYLTLLDKHALIGFLYVALAVAVVARVHVAIMTQRSAHAAWIQRTARWVFPLSYAALVLTNLITS